MAAEEEHDDLSLFQLATAKLSDVQKLTDEAHYLLKQDLERVREEKSNFEKMMKTLNQVHFTRTVKLKVGGKIYMTTLNTLRKDPDSMLCAMSSFLGGMKSKLTRKTELILSTAMVNYSSK